MNSDFIHEIDSPKSKDINEESKENSASEYLDVKSAYMSKNQLLSIEPIEKYYIGSAGILRGSSHDLSTLNHSLQNLLLNPQGREKQHLDYLGEKMVKDTQKRKKHMRNDFNYDMNNRKEDIYRFKNPEIMSVQVNDNYEQEDHLFTISNNGAISSIFSMVEYRFNKMFSRRQFVPNFTDSLISEMEMVEARETVEMMIEEYTK